MTRIRRNAHRQIRDIANRAKSITVYSLDNGFTGEDRPVGGYLAVLALITKEVCFGASVWRCNPDGTKYQIRTHSNLWFVLHCTPQV